MINLKPILLLSAVLIYCSNSIAQNVGIGTEKPHPKARLDISDSSRGVLIPRLTAKQRRAIENPPIGLILYQLDDSSGIWYFEKTWKLVAPVNGNPATPSIGNWSLTGNSGLDSVDNFLGTTDSGRVNFRSNNIERLRIEANGDLKFNKYKNNTALDSVLTTDSSGKLLMSVSSGANSITFDSITNLYKYKGPRTLAFVKDSVVGGFFYRYNGLSPVDSGVVITDTLNRKWHRYITTNYVDVRWWGAKAADINFDNRPAFLSALKFATAIPLDPAQTYPHLWAGRVYIPASDKYYYCSDSILITKTVEIFGDGIYSKPRFATNKTGFYIDTSCSLTRIRDLAISAYGTTTPVITAHGISIKCNVRLDNVTVTGFSGNGFNIEAGAPFGSSNANNSIFFNCHAQQNNEHGYYIKGADANNMVFYSCEAVANNRWGVNDQCFLGNHYYNFHSASNGSPELQYQRTVAKNPSNNHFYAAIQDGVLPEPGVAPNWQNYWYDMGTGLFTGYNIDYSASKFYETGGHII